MGKVRRSGRIAKEIRILLLGMDSGGKVFSEETRTVTLSRHGAGIISKHKLATHGLLILRFLGGSTEAAIRLVGQLGQDARGFVYGVAFVDEDEDFWELKFPPPPVWNIAVEGPMECESCKRCEVVDQSEIEADVYALSESIFRYCIYCGTPTMWKRVADAVVAISKEAMLETVTANVTHVAGSVGSARVKAGVQTPAQERAQPTSDPKGVAQGARPRPDGEDLLMSEPPDAPALSPAASSIVAKAANRRKDVRTGVSFSACVRFQESEEIVECANLSKRGFGFRSRKEYPVGSDILVAVPFYEGMPPSFVTGSVRHVTALPNHNFQYGVMYLNAPARDGHESEHKH
jgi:hypothetical protein